MRLNIKREYSKLYRIARKKIGSAYRYKKWGQPQFVKADEYGQVETERWQRGSYVTAIVNYATQFVFEFKHDPDYDGVTTDVEVKDIDNKKAKDSTGTAIHAGYEDDINIIYIYKFGRDEYGNPDPSNVIELGRFDLNGNQVSSAAVNPPLGNEITPLEDFQF